MSLSQASSAGIIGQSMVSVLSTATLPSASAETLSGRVMPQMPGPSISAEGTIVAEGVTSFLAKQAFSAWVRQIGRSGRLKKPHPESDRAAINAGSDGHTRRAIASICMFCLKNRFTIRGLRHDLERFLAAIAPPHFSPKRRAR